jgi:hypothetical protein
MKDDKIFNNRYNTGEIEFEQFGKIQPHESQKLHQDEYEESTERELQDTLYGIFIESSYYEAYSKNKKVARSDAAGIYYYFVERLPKTAEITAVSKFVNIAEFMSIPYEVLYEEIGPVYKEEILRELDGKYNIFSRRKIKRLF